MSGRLYEYNDPDYSVFEGFSPAENMTRVIATVVSGTVYLNGDDLTRGSAQSLARTYRPNPRINAVARIGKAFRPVEGNTGTKPSELFTLGHGGASYLAAFNFAGKGVTKRTELWRAGLDPNRTYTVTDLWTGQSWTVRGSLEARPGERLRAPLAARLSGWCRGATPGLLRWRRTWRRRPTG